MRAGYKGRELLRSFFFSITHCFWRFIKGFCLRSDGKTESSAISLDGCGVARSSKCKTVGDDARSFLVLGSCASVDGV
jgi:hypothetical protein